MATKFEVKDMMNNAVSSLKTSEDKVWEFFARAGWLLSEAHDTKARKQRAMNLERQLSMTGRYSADTTKRYVQKAQIVANYMERFANVVPVNADGFFVDNKDEKLSFCEMLTYGHSDITEEWANGSIIQRVRALWGSVNEIKASGPFAERKDVAPKKAKASAVTQVQTQTVTDEPAVTQTVVETFAIDEKVLQSLSSSEFAALLARVNAEQMRRAEADALELIAA